MNISVLRVHSSSPWMRDALTLIYIFNFFQWCSVLFSIQIFHLLNLLFLFSKIIAAVVSGIVFLISFSDCSLLVYRNTIHFYNNDLVPCNLLDLSISSFFVWVFQVFLCTRLCHLQIDNFTFKFEWSFIYFFLLNYPGWSQYHIE